MASFKKGTPKLPHSGRKKGTPNKMPRTVLEICQEAGCDPLQAMIECMQMPEYKFAAAKELLKYAYPTLGTLDIVQTKSEHQERVAKEIEDIVMEAQLLEGK